MIEPWMFPNMVLAHQPSVKDDPTLSQTQAVYVNNVNKYFGPVAAVQVEACCVSATFFEPDLMRHIQPRFAVRSIWSGHILPGLATRSM